MDDREKDQIKLRFGLALTRLLDKQKAVGKSNKLQGFRDRNLVDSYLKLERASGLPKATVIGIFQGRINAASSSLSAILEALGASFTIFGEVYDNIKDTDLLEFAKLVAQKRQLQLQKARKSPPGKVSPKKPVRKKEKGK